MHATKGLRERMLRHGRGDMQHLPVSLLGARYGSNVTLLDVGGELEPASIGRKDGALLHAAKGIACLLPVGVEVVGCSLVRQSHSQQDAREMVQNLRLPEGGGPLVMAVVDGEQVSYWQGTSPFDKLSVTEDSAAGAGSSSRGYALLRLSLPLKLEVCVGGNVATDISTAFSSLRLRLNLEEAQFLVQATSSSEPSLLREDGQGSGNLGTEIPVEQPGIVQLVSNSSCGLSSAPTASYQPFEGPPRKMRRVTVGIDVLMYVPRRNPLGALTPETVRSAVSRQLDQAERVLEGWGEVTDVSALHFRPHGHGHHLTLLCPTPADKDGEAAEEKLMPQRKLLHQQLLLPADRPLLRRSNAVSFDAGGGHGGGGPELRNVHEGLGPSGVSGGQVHMVWGTYRYFHYMQGRMDDSGWGCAYRSLQTIASWFLAQGFTQRPIPSHRDIQQVLVDIGDKERSFVGSRQWIGAIEIGFVIETLLGVTSKVITVPSGRDMDQKAREIAHHFDSQGTPIMIGGGVLAYTLLGVDFNPSTGECAYLILDPHYTGADDLKKVHKGQWVAWKRADGKASAGGDLFADKSFYNLLCPQRPLFV